ncbi:MAG TPA: hypothetical protein VH188_06340 [Chthoniobacterales bacterium]|jgi:hypothetical protein|nr:hypothetical protein [Chthoniobacterales bacterium]
MYYLIGRPKDISDLKGELRPPIATLREKVKIVAIDDDGFEYAEVLRRHGFQINVQNDITDITAIETYPVVICDIAGVGRSFRSPYEGAHVIAEIRKRYPTKYLIAYTGQRFDASYNRFFALCDASMRKDSESQEWVEALDAAIKVYVDPAEMWRKARQVISPHVTPMRLTQLEDDYVRAVLKNRRPFQNEQKLIDLPNDARAVLLGIASNVLFKLIGG